MFTRKSPKGFTCTPGSLPPSPLPVPALTAISPGTSQTSNGTDMQKLKPQEWITKDCTPSLTHARWDDCTRQGSVFCIFSIFCSPWQTADSTGIVNQRVKARQASLAAQMCACSAGGLGSIPGLERSPGEGNGDRHSSILAGECHGCRSLAGYSPKGHRVRQAICYMKPRIKTRWIGQGGVSGVYVLFPSPEKHMQLLNMKKITDSI